MKLEELIACREDIWTFLVAWGVDNRTAFLASEYIRKGKWNDLKENIKKNIQEKLGLTGKSIEKMAKELNEKQAGLIESISHELVKLNEEELINLLKKINI
jgi:hypothetical protein